MRICFSGTDRWIPGQKPCDKQNALQNGADCWRVLWRHRLESRARLELANGSSGRRLCPLDQSQQRDSRVGLNRSQPLSRSTQLRLIQRTQPRSCPSLAIPRRRTGGVDHRSQGLHPPPQAAAAQPLDDLNSPLLANPRRGTADGFECHLCAPASARAGSVRALRRSCLGHRRHA